MHLNWNIARELAIAILDLKTYTINASLATEECAY